jgi:hypothetical protein
MSTTRKLWLGLLALLTVSFIAGMHHPLGWLYGWLA